MFEVQDFVRLMVGEAIRDESTARAVGLDLFTSFQTSIEDWVRTHRPDLDEQSGAAEVARLLSAMVVGMFVQYAAGVLAEAGDDLTALSLQRAREAADILRPVGSGRRPAGPSARALAHAGCGAPHCRRACARPTPDRGGLGRLLGAEPRTCGATGSTSPTFRSTTPT